MKRWVFELASTLVTSNCGTGETGEEFTVYSQVFRRKKYTDTYSGIYPTVNIAILTK